MPKARQRNKHSYHALGNVRIHVPAPRRVATEAAGGVYRGGIGLKLSISPTQDFPHAPYQMAHALYGLEPNGWWSGLL